MTREKRPLVITERDLETLDALEAANRNLTDVGFRKGWARPMDCGAWNGSHHSKTLRKLATLGFVDTNRTPGAVPGYPNSRPSIGYKINANGAARLALWRMKRKEARHASAAQ